MDGLSLSVILLILKAVPEKLPEALLRNLSRRMWPLSEAVPSLRLKFSIALRSLLAARMVQVTWLAGTTKGVPRS